MLQGLATHTSAIHPQSGGGYSATARQCYYTANDFRYLADVPVF